MANDILIRWLSDSTQAVRDMTKMERALAGTTSNSQKYARRWNTASLLMRRSGIALGTALVAVGVQAGKSAARQEQALGGLEAVFKGQAEGLKVWARGLSDVGISMTDATNYATKFGASLKGAGYSQKDAADQTQRLVELGADLAATFDGPGGVNGAIDALGASLRGEYDPLEQWGVALTAAKVNAELAKTGQDKLTGAALAQAQQAARLKLIWEGTRDAQGQAAREADTASAAYRRFTAKLENVKADLGKVLLPVMSDLAGRMADITAAAEENPEAVRNWAKGLAALAASMVALSYSAKAVTVVQGLATAVRKFPGLAAVATIAAAVTALRKFAGPQKLADFWNDRVFTVGFWKGLGSAVVDFGRRIGSLVLDIPGVKQLALGLAKITDLLRLTSGEYERTKAIFDAPIEIKAANEQALDAANTVQALLDDLNKARPKPIINAANDLAKRAAAEAQRAIDNVKQRKKAQVDADAALARAKVAAWEAWAAARRAIDMTVSADTTQARTQVSGLQNWINGLGAAINVSASVTRARSSVGGIGVSRAASTFAAAPVASPVTININGFAGNEDMLARKVVSALDGARMRYNRRGLAR